MNCDLPYELQVMISSSEKQFFFFFSEIKLIYLLKLFLNLKILIKLFQIIKINGKINEIKIQISKKKILIKKRQTLNRNFLLERYYL